MHACVRPRPTARGWALPTETASNARELELDSGQAQQAAQALRTTRTGSDRNKHNRRKNKQHEHDWQNRCNKQTCMAGTTGTTVTPGTAYKPSRARPRHRRRARHRHYFPRDSAKPSPAILPWLQASRTSGCPQRSGLANCASEVRSELSISIGTTGGGAV